ncbi:hypothetical protein AK88_04146 [Plasmodium fragile]|uniref:Schizont-infected cell agglutination extracellular alpha domain-containing protein n=1 Tax=Plasmodium fragile TaxID=5857 RepID=A0A0D9QGJ7_PLAFR|nr:uncharacterized protein AK88_04146 [Plasmodium fragile]KJP86175.1 hypothetical protein AK88_04146 [Plasmodium fragile]
MSGLLMKLLITWMKKHGLTVHSKSIGNFIKAVRKINEEFLHYVSGDVDDAITAMCKNRISEYENGNIEMEPKDIPICEFILRALYFKHGLSHEVGNSNIKSILNTNVEVDLCIKCTLANVYLGNLFHKNCLDTPGEKWAFVAAANLLNALGRGQGNIQCDEVDIQTTAVTGENIRQRMKIWMGMNESIMRKEGLLSSQRTCTAWNTKGKKGVSVHQALPSEPVLRYTTSYKEAGRDAIEEPAQKSKTKEEDVITSKGKETQRNSEKRQGRKEKKLETNKLTTQVAPKHPAAGLPFAGKPAGKEGHHNTTTCGQNRQDTPCIIDGQLQSDPWNSKNGDECLGSLLAQWVQKKGLDNQAIEYDRTIWEKMTKLYTNVAARGGTGKSEIMENAWIEMGRKGGQIKQGEEQIYKLLIRILLYMEGISEDGSLEMEQMTDDYEMESLMKCVMGNVWINGIKEMGCWTQSAVNHAINAAEAHVITVKGEKSRIKDCLKWQFGDTCVGTYPVTPRFMQWMLKSNSVLGKMYGAGMAAKCNGKSIADRIEEFYKEAGTKVSCNSGGQRVEMIEPSTDGKPGKMARGRNTKKCESKYWKKQEDNWREKVTILIEETNKKQEEGSRKGSHPAPDESDESDHQVDSIPRKRANEDHSIQGGDNLTEKTEHKGNGDKNDQETEVESVDGVHTQDKNKIKANAERTEEKPVAGTIPQEETTVACTPRPLAESQASGAETTQETTEKVAAGGEPNVEKNAQGKGISVISSPDDDSPAADPSNGVTESSSSTKNTEDPEDSSRVQTGQATERTDPNNGARGSQGARSDGGNDETPPLNPPKPKPETTNPDQSGSSGSFSHADLADGVSGGEGKGGEGDEKDAGGGGRCCSRCI